LNANVLIAASDPALRQAAHDALAGAGFLVTPALSVAEARAELLHHEPDVLVVALSRASADELDLLRRAREQGTDCKVIALVARGWLEGGVAALEAGASMFLEHPFATEGIVAVVRGAAITRAMEQRAIYASAHGRARSDAATFIHAAPRMTQLIPHIEAIARSAVPAVLVTGETGTGKAAVARMLHDASPRSAGPFVELACTDVPERRAEGVLFGEHQTSGGRRAPGLLEIADGGTLFLDELADLDATAQARLLRFLESGELRRSGARAGRQVDVRVVASSKRDLRAMAAARGFRADLLHRLEAITLGLPPLRERRGDIEALSVRFMTETVREHARPFKSISPEAHNLLQSYRWPGNVWELRFVVRRAVLRYDGEVLLVPHLAHVLPDPSLTAKPVTAGPGEGGTASTVIPTLAQIDLAHIRRVLEICNGNRTLAAHHLGITRQTLAKRLGAAEAD
jgi:DNA-binding NtrC family response regulator